MFLLVLTMLIVKVGHSLSRFKIMKVEYRFFSRNPFLYKGAITLCHSCENILGVWHLQTTCFVFFLSFNLIFIIYPFGTPFF